MYPYALGAQFRRVHIAHDRVEPSHQVGAGLETVLCGEGMHDSRLHQIVRFGAGPAQRAGEGADTRQTRYDAFPEAGGVFVLGGHATQTERRKREFPDSRLCIDLEIEKVVAAKLGNAETSLSRPGFRVA